MRIWTTGPGQAAGIAFAVGETDTSQVNIEPSYDIHAAAEAHLEAVWDAFYAQEDADEGVEIPTPAVGPFCGCETCLVRETIAGAWPVIEAYFVSRGADLAS